MIYSVTKKIRKDEDGMQQNEENQHGLQNSLVERQVSFTIFASE